MLSNKPALKELRFSYSLFPVAGLTGCLRFFFRIGLVARLRCGTMVLIDGPPGIGCPVIASLTGVDYALAVTEPTMSGIHDLKRISELCRHFFIPVGVVINKFDLNPLISEEIKKFAETNHYDFIGRIPYDPDFTRAMVQGKSLMEFNSSPVSNTISEMWEYIKNLIK